MEKPLYELWGTFIPENINEYERVGFVRLLVTSYAEIMDIDILDSAYWVKNTFCKQLDVELTNKEWGDVIGKGVKSDRK